MTTGASQHFRICCILFSCLLFLSNATIANLYAQNDKPPTQQDFQPAIVGGTVSAVNAWPWQGMLLRNGGFRCGASLVAEQWVVTAAHCLYEAGNVLQPNELSVVLGENNLVVPSQSRQTVAVDQRFIHPGYSGECCQHDLALLKLIRPATINAATQIVPLLQTDASDLLPTLDTRGFATGWGLTSLGASPATLLQQVALTVTMQFTQDGYFVASGIGAQAICYGDSGGPFVMQVAGRWHLAGVSSFGGCNPGGGFARIADHAGWINNTMAVFGPTWSAATAPGRAFLTIVSR